ncbi:hypothetical protein FDECE_2380 [Fusarium decemcellulare]|nr:hypothetical protein FDECE_2380 [Fusarium decemcellulare]
MAPPSEARKTRTEAQLSRKRLVDRVKHRENRQSHKAQLERIEQDVAFILQSLSSITEQLNYQTQSHTLTRQPVIFHDMLVVPSQESPRGTLSYLATPHTAVATFPTPSRVLDCRCGMRHSDHFESLELCGVTGIYQNQVASPKTATDATSKMPRNPALPSMMLHSDGDNFITSLITPFLRDLKTGSMETLLGGYLYAYRLIRWQLNPCPSTLEDVPAWLLPTAAQVSNPHPVCIDFLPWPKLREHLCLTQSTGSPHSVQLYWDSVRLCLPPGCEMLGRDDSGKISLSKEFEAAALDNKNWRMNSPWADVFPHLMHLVEEDI